MPSEKWRYLSRRTGSPKRTDIDYTPLKAEIEAIFDRRNIDEDCSKIASLLEPYRYFVKSSLEKSNYEDAVLALLEVMESLTYHFVQDEHYCHFDDMYSPDYECQSMMEDIIEAIQSGTFTDAALQQLQTGIAKLEMTEAYRDYCTPYAITLWQSHSH